MAKLFMHLLFYIVAFVTSEWGDWGTTKRSSCLHKGVQVPNVHYLSSPTAPWTLECVGKATEESSDKLYYNLELTARKPEVKYTTAWYFFLPIHRMFKMCCHEKSRWVDPDKGETEPVSAFPPFLASALQGQVFNCPLDWPPIRWHSLWVAR